MSKSHGQVDLNSSRSHSQLDFKSSARAFVSQLPRILSDILPGGKVIGTNYKCGSISGGQGESFSVKLESGQWKDFADSSMCGGDVISLYAKIKGISQLESLKDLKGTYGGAISSNPSRGSAQVQKSSITRPPTGIRLDEQSFNNKKLGAASAVWTYKGLDGELLFYVARYELTNGEKSYMPFCWDSLGKGWVNKAWPKPRPLYGLEILNGAAGKGILLCEGEKACDAARSLLGPDSPYICMTWPNGASSLGSVDWSPIYGRKILIWPDADKAGIEARDAIVRLLSAHVPEVKYIDVSDFNGGADCADFYGKSLNEWADFKVWAMPRVKVALVHHGDEPSDVMDIEDVPMPECDDAPIGTIVPAEPVVVVDESVIENVSHTEFMTWGLRFTKAKDPEPFVNESNVTIVLDRAPEFKGAFWYDKFHNKLFTSWGKSEGHALREEEMTTILCRLQSRYWMPKLGLNTCRNAIVDVCYRDERNEVKSWLEGLTWDGVARIDSLFSSAFGCEDSEYIRAVSANVIKSLVARIQNPGCKVDNMVILEGKQGTKKSTIIEALAGVKYFAEAEDEIKTKDFRAALQGRLIVEIGELSAFSNAETSLIKKIVSCRIDRFRKPYRREHEEFPRVGIFIGSTNDSEYLRDVTGNRRFWPIEVVKCNVEYVRGLRDQLFAEARERLALGGSWWEMPTSVEEIQESRLQQDPWHHDIEFYCKGLRTVSIKEIAESKLKIEVKNIDQKVNRRIGNILKILGFRNQSVRETCDVTNLSKVVKKWTRDAQITLIKERVVKNYAPNLDNEQSAEVT